MKHNLEKDLKRWLKRKISISLATIVIFAITGSVGVAQNATLEGENNFTGNNTFEGGKQESTFTVEVKGKATDPKDKKKMVEDQESTVKHTLTAVGSYTRADGKKKIHNAIMQRDKLESMDEKDQIVFHTLDDTGSHLAARGAKKPTNGQNQDSGITLSSKIFDENNKEIASQTFHYDGIYVKAMKEKKIHNSIEGGIQFELNKNGSYTTGKKENNIVNKVEESVETRLDKEGSKVEVEKEKKIVNKVKDGAKLVMDKEASRFTKDLYVGNLVWRDRSQKENELVIGDKENEASGKNSGAIGFGNSVVGDESFAVGIKNIASGLGAPKKVLLFGIENRSIGNTSAAFGIYNIVKGDYSSAFGIHNESSASESFAFGFQNIAKGPKSSAFGIGNHTMTWDSSAFGIRNIAKGEQSSAFGISNRTESWSSSAFGIYNIAKGVESSSFGVRNSTKGSYSSAFGRANVIISDSSTAVGNSLFVSGENSGSFGNGMMDEPEIVARSAGASPYNPYLYRNEGKNSYTVGNLNSIAKETENNFILGNDNIIGYVENNSTLRSGSSIKGKANNNFIIGNKVKIQEGISNSVVLGNESAVRQATTETKGTVGSIEFGGFAGQGKPENGVVSVGAKDKERQIINVAAGKVSQDSTDAINGSQLFSAVQELAKGTNHYYSVNSKEMGEGSNYKNDGATAEGAMAAGVKAKASGNQSTSVGYANNANGDFSTAIGAENIANGERSVALGYQNKIESEVLPHKGRGIAIGNSNILKNSFTGVTVGDNNKLSGEYAVAFGTNNTASAKNTTVIGRSNKIFGVSSTGIGHGNKVKGESAIAAGYYNEVFGNYSSAIGKENKVFGKHSGVFGISNEIFENSDNNFILGSNVKIIKDKTGTPITNSVVLGNSSAVEESNVISIGAKGTERKIVHVKAGEADTDAVNVSQLKETNSNLTIKGMDFVGNDGERVHRKLGEALTLKGEGTNSSGFQSAEGNINVKKSADGELEFQLTKKLQNIDSISNQGSTIMLSQGKIAMNQALHMGDANKQNQIKFVADGTQETDAVNFRQLEKAKTRYYSINSKDKGIGSNYNNDGATGKDAMAAGVKAKATAVEATSIGYANEAMGQYSSAIGHKNIVDKRAYYSSAIGESNNVIGSRSVAFGRKNTVKSFSSSAIGTENMIEANSGNSIVMGDLNKVEIEASNSIVSGRKNMVQQGSSYSAAFGEENILKGSHISAFGEGNKVTGNDSLAIGEKNEVEGRYDFVLGTENKVRGEHNAVLGEKNEIAKNAEYNFILGSNVKVKENTKNSVVLGKDSTVEESDVVSVGATGKERKIVHVKAGVNDTDAVNVSQLKKYSSDLEKKGLNFAGNDEKSVHRDLGATLTLKGEGVDKTASESFRGASGNINVKNSKEGELLLQLAEELKNIKSVANGNNKIILEGDKVIFNQALHMGDSNTQHQIKYVADGTDLTDAVNLKQLKEYNIELEKKGLNFAGNDGKVIHKNLGDTLEIVGSLGDGEDASSQNLRTRKTDDGKLELLLAQNLKLNSVTTGNTIINNFGVTIQEGDKK
ncbi:MAG: hypothetical protein SPH94_04965, partial [Fusobacterium necrophorum]|nr:hypothetical protein [Fusobacterium necrophorum]